MNIAVDDSLKRIKDNLTRRQQTIAVAESVTSGLLQNVISTTEEASLFFQGGITVYNVGQKCRHLGIDPVHALKCNSVSERIANDMAKNVCELFTSDWGIGITGYATPVPESDNQLFAYVAIYFKGTSKSSFKLEASIDDTQKVQLFYVHRIIEEFVKLIEPETKNSHKNVPTLK